MKKLFGVVLAMWAALIFMGCLETTLTNDRPEDGDTPDDPAIGDVNNSGCKADDPAPMARGTNADGSMPDFNPIEAVVHGDSVTIVHHDAVYQCGAEIQFALRVDGTDLTLTENDVSTEVTRCVCPIDLSVELLNLKPGLVYHVEVWNEFHTELFGAVDVSLDDCDNQCRTADDCWAMDLPVPQCVGDWACVEGFCEWRCGGEEGCWSDSDCPRGFHCEFYYPMPADPTEPPQESEVRPDGTVDGGAGDTPDGSGGATPSDPGMPEMMCASDYECPAGMWCELQTNCWPPSDDCGAYGICRGEQPWEQPGMCVPDYPIDRCAEVGGFCNPLAPDGALCPEGFEPAVEAFWQEPLCGLGGVCCVPAPIQCETDEDCMVYADPATGADANGDGQTDDAYWGRMACIDGACQWVDDCNYYTCASDADCGYGSICVYYEECQENGQCCGGSYCEWTEPPCYSDMDCPSGMVCVNGFCTGDCACDTYYEPVCGADGQTYSNECFAKCSGVDILYWGECENICPDSPVPYCAPGYELVVRYDERGCAWYDCVPSGERCYSSDECPAGYYCTVDDGECLPPWECDDPNGDCGDMPAVCTGVCQPLDSCVCPEYYHPVCGSDGQTYDNECFAECAGVRIVHDGFCEGVPCAADSDCAPGEACMDGVCLALPCDYMDADGRCFCGGFAGFVCPAGQECFYDDPNCDPAAGGADCLGHCEPATCACDDVWAPVCGADGQTYGNDCEARCAGVGVVHEGPCGEIEPQCGADSDCPAGFFCNTCPPDPTCPICAVCGPAICEPVGESCSDFGGICAGINSGVACPPGFAAIEADVPLCAPGAMCCAPVDAGGK
ncbi:MAG: hypothetical protein C4523_14705 [Myxococcales bacterium]|nr:MAG: hypothetical protein C4523_14705 [Myxococcales bacterium]